MNKAAECHPERPHCALGKCKKCYYILTKIRQLSLGRARYKRNKEQILLRCKEYRKRTPEKARNRQLLRLYGISLEDYNHLLKIQQYGCKLCGTTPIKIPVVDHNHTTKVVRGIICQGCNIVVGFFDNRPEIFAKVSTYAEERSNDKS